MAGPLRVATPTLPQLLRLPPLPSIKDLLRIYRVRASKHLSQNFLLDDRYNQKIVKVLGNLRGHYVCEIGPGPGNITRPLLEKGVANVTVIEKDRRFIPCLELLEEASQGRMKVVLGDVMNHPFENIFPPELATPWEDQPPPCHIIGNLPFSLASPLLMNLMRHCAYRTGPFSMGRVNMVLSFQKEVAERIVAPNTSPFRGLFSVLCQYLFDVGFAVNIPGNAFIPPPNVDVGVIHFRPWEKPLIGLPHDLVLKVVKATFTFKNKHCKKSIATLFPKTRADMTYEMIKLADIDPCMKPVDLSVDDFSRLCYAYQQLMGPQVTYTLEVTDQKPRPVYLRAED